MSYPEPQWTRTTILVSQIIQAFNLKANVDLVKAYNDPKTRSIVSVLLEAVRRISPAMGQLWTFEARKLVVSDSLFPALRATKTVLEDILYAEFSSDADSNLENIPIIKL